MMRWDGLSISVHTTPRGESLFFSFLFFFFFFFFSFWGRRITPSALSLFLSRHLSRAFLIAGFRVEGELRWSVGLVVWKGEGGREGEGVGR